MLLAKYFLGNAHLKKKGWGLLRTQMYILRLVIGDHMGT